MNHTSRHHERPTRFTGGRRRRPTVLAMSLTCMLILALPAGAGAVMRSGSAWRASSST
jgi:hypothetical protein